MSRRKIVRMLGDDKAFKLKKGDVLEAVPYQFDRGKLTVIRRLSDDWDPGCNVYTLQVKFLGSFA